MKSFRSLSVFFGAISVFPALGVANTIDDDRAAILKMAGCFVVDYNYHEIEALVPGYSLDPREYHASRNPDFKKFVEMYPLLDPDTTPENYQLSVKEKIWVRENTPDGIHLQHVVFLTNENGEVDFVMKHHSEFWRFEADRTFEYSGGMSWKPTELEGTQGHWTRELNALDDSPRYSCTAAWDHSREFPRWTCSSYAPIPGREYRDMGRKDYQGLDRTHMLTVYPNAWLDAQDNRKVRENGNERTAFVRELGRNWYTRLPNKTCEVVDPFISARADYWRITQSVWDELLMQNASIRESQRQDGPRWLHVMGGPLIVHPGRKMVQYKKGIEDTYLQQRTVDPAQATQTARDAIKAVIQRYDTL